MAETDHQRNERMMARWTRRLGILTNSLRREQFCSDSVHSAAEAAARGDDKSGGQVI